MGKSRQLKRRSSLQTTLSAWLLLVALVPLLTALGIIVAQSDAALRLATRSTLQDVAEQQSRALNEYLAARQRDALLVAQWPPVQSTLFQSSNGQSDPTGATTRNASIRPLLKSLVGLSGIADILLVDQTGTVVLAHNAAYDGQRLSESSTLPPAIQLVVERAQTLFASDISDLVMVPGRPTPVIYLAAPVLHAGRIVGAVVVELQTTSIPYLTDADGLQRTGEIAVGQRQGDQVLLLMPRIGPDGVKLTGALVPLERDPLMARSSAGDHGFGEVTDDQHVAVVAVWRYLPAYRWGMVVKIDQAEAYAMRRSRLTIAILVTLATIVVVIGLSLLVARAITTPIRQATTVARLFTSGDLTQRMLVTRTDEVGLLGDSFNALADTLTQRITAYERSQATLAASNQSLQTALTQVDDLEVPLIQVLAGVFVLPLVGQVDVGRAKRLEARVLQRAASARARAVVIDLTGITGFGDDTLVTVVRLGQALRLLGIRPVVCGIGARQAQALAGQGEALDGMVVVRELAAALQLLLPANPPAGRRA